MKNIIKAMNYQTRKDILTFITLLLAFIIPFAMVFLNGGDAPMDYTGSDVICYIGSIFPIVCLVVIFLFTCRICGWDYLDCTLNYEILAGHTRFQVYMGRILTSILWCIAGFFLCACLPVLFFTCLNGWGDTVSFSSAILRYGLMILLIIRLTVGFGLLAFLFRNSYLAMIVGYAVTGVSGVVSLILEDTFGSDISVFVGWMNMSRMFQFDNSKYVLIDGKETVVFDGVISNSLLYGTLGWSLLVIIIFLWLGYRVFRNQDLR